VAKRLLPSARRQRGVLSVEAAYVLPVIIAAAMMFMELANIGLTINVGAGALDRAIQQFRQGSINGSLQGDAMESQLRKRMVAASHNYLDDTDIATVEIERFTSLDALGGGNAANEENAPAATSTQPAWRVSVDIRKNFITPLPRLLGVDSSAFRYRYEQVLAYLPQATGAQQ